jgi:hypothetical protein
LHYIFYLIDASQQSTLTLRTYLAWLLPNSGSDSSEGALPNVFSEGAVFIKKNRGAEAVLEQP